MTMVTIFTTFNSAEADLLRVRLEAANFHVDLRGDIAVASLGMASTLGGIQVQVPEEEAAEARAMVVAPADSPCTPNGTRLA